MGGGTPIARVTVSRPVGLSPRGRGNPGGSCQSRGRRRSIPAWAGEPGVQTRFTAANTVYPRVGGGTTGSHGCICRRCGLSPRGAGEPPSLRRRSETATVYPRVGGGTITSPKTPAATIGLSPRGRGNHLRLHQHTKSSGSIPALGGGTNRNNARMPNPTGLSPRGRGNRGKRIPGLRTTEVYPRVGGGTSPKTALWPRVRGLSPRGRGNHAGAQLAIALLRSIPAWAGEPLVAQNNHLFSGVYPRVGGGTQEVGAFYNTPRGLSPRGRGNRTPESFHVLTGRSIPAWAGEP